MPLTGKNILSGARLAGYCRPVKHLSRDKRDEFNARKTYKLTVTGCLSRPKTR